jgi:uncharacterized metal-binding protein YceD (DUF177 family)
MFKVQLSEILTAVGEKKTGIFEVPINYRDELCAFTGPVTATLTITNLGSMVLVKGLVKANVMLVCDRCANDYSEIILGEVEQEFRSEEQLFQFDSSDRKLGREDLKFTIDPRGNIDIEELLREVIVSNIPLKQICPNCPEAVTYRAK